MFKIKTVLVLAIRYKNLMDEVVTFILTPPKMKS
jgi:hypothetical protein